MITEQREHFAAVLRANCVSTQAVQVLLFEQVWQFYIPVKLEQLMHLAAALSAYCEDKQVRQVLLLVQVEQ